MALKLSLILSLLVALAVSSDIFRDVPPHHRDIVVSVTKQVLQFEAKYEDPTTRYSDFWNFKMNLGRLDNQVLRGFFQYQSTAPNTTRLQFDFAIRSLMEINTTKNEYFRGDNSSIISRWPTDSKGVEFDDWVDHSVLVNGTKIYSYSATSKDSVFTIRVSVADVPVHLLTVPIGPNDVKIDFMVNKFPYTHNTSRLTLQTHLNSITESMNTPSQAILTDNLVFSGTPGYPFGSFSWQNRANATTEDVTVIAWSPQTRVAKNFDVFFTFLTSKTVTQPAILVWDPRMGLDYWKGEAFCIGRVCGIGAYFVIIGIILAAMLLVGLIVAGVVSRRRSSYESIHDNPPPTYTVS